jgi:hypothetical protein
VDDTYYMSNTVTSEDITVNGRTFLITRTVKGYQVTRIRQYGVNTTIGLFDLRIDAIDAAWENAGAIDTDTVDSFLVAECDHEWQRSRYTGERHCLNCDAMKIGGR